MLIVGLAAGILGLVAASFSYTVHSTVPEHFVVYSASLFIESASLTLMFSIIGIIGALLLNRQPKIAGLFMITAAIGGFIFLTYSYFPSTILFLIAGIKGLFTKRISE